MPFYAAVPLVDDLLGNTTLYEEQRGDFAQARQHAEQHLGAARRNSDTFQLADALLARGIVHLLQGEAAAARACLEEAEERAGSDPERQLRARAYVFQAMLLGFNYFPNGAVASAQEISARVDLVAYTESWQKRLDQAQALVRDPALLLEHRLLSIRQFVMLARQAISTSISFGLQMRESFTSSFQQFRESVAPEGAHPRLLAALDIQLADLQFGAGQSEPALETLKRASASYEQLGDPVGVANCLMKLGDWMVAPFGPPEVWNSAIAESSPSSALRWEVEAIEFDTSRLDVARARAFYEQSRSYYQAGGSARGLAAIELRYGYLAILDGDAPPDTIARYTQAAEHAAQACEQYQRAEDWLGFQVARAHQALCRIGMGQSPEDQQIAEEIGGWGRTVGSFSFSLGLGLLFARIGRRWLVREGDYERALACFRLAEAVFRGLDAPLCQARSVTDQSIVYEMLGDRNAFIVTAERAWDLCEVIVHDRQALVDPAWQQANWIATNLFQLGNKHADPDSIARVAERMLALQVHMQSSQGPAPTNADDALAQTLAKFHSLSSDSDNAEQMLSLATAGVAQGMIEQSRFLVPLYRGRQARIDFDVAAAEMWFAQALEAARTSRGLSRAYMEASVLAYQKRYDESIPIYRLYLDQERAKVTILGLPPELQRDQLRNTQKQGFLIFTRIKQYAEAQIYLDALVALDGSQWWTQDGPAWDNLSTAGELYEGLERWDEALAAYEQAMTIFERQRHQLTSDELKTALASGSGTQYMYFQAARTALKAREAAQDHGDAAGGQVALARAFDAIERGKARSLLDLMASGALIGGGAAESEVLNRWRRQSAYLATRRGLLANEHSQNQPNQAWIDALEREITTAEQELRVIESDLSSADPQLYRAQTAGSQVLALDAVSAMLPADTAVLQYAFLGEDLLAWAITRTGTVQVHRATLPENLLRRRIRTFHRLCEGGRLVEQLGKVLAETLLAPFDQTIADHSRLIIVPYGVGHLLPFQALPWRGQPLVATHTITYLPSASFIQFMRFDATPAQPQRVLAVGNPANMHYQAPGSSEPKELNSLPAAETEAAYIVSLFPGSKALLGAQATAKAVRAELHSYSILHFATHGHLSADVPLLSAIMLAGGDALTVYELMGLHLNADLVVLSACRTGQGETTAGDDVVGMSRAMLSAGARSVLVSLWPVADAATSILMGAFYRHLRDGDAPAEALRAAQQYLRTRSRDDLRGELAGLRAGLEQRGSDQSTIQPVEQGLRWIDRFIESAEQLRFADSNRPTAVADDYSHPFFWAPFILVGT
jgi:CHAT domain-containing protein